MHVAKPKPFTCSISISQVVNCGGYKYNMTADGKPDEVNPGDYLSLCQKLPTKAGPWELMANLTTARAFFAMVNLPVDVSLTECDI